MVSILVKLIEESSYCHRVLKNTCADHLPSGLKFMAYNPPVCLIVTIVVYLLICVIYLPLYLSSFIVTTTGSRIIFVIAIVLSLRSLGRMIAFPGSTTSYQKELAQQYMQRLFSQLESCCGATIVFCNNVMHASTGM